MLRGAKRFRVAGKALGSAVSIDHVLRPGDALFIPAGCFHSGAVGYLDRDVGSRKRGQRWVKGYGRDRMQGAGRVGIV